MRLAASLFAVALLGACAPAEEAPPAMEEAPAAAALTLADFAGTWDNVATIEGVPDPIPSTTHGSADPTGWTMDALHKLISFQAGASSALPQLMILVVATAAVGTLAVRRFKYE